MNSTQHTGRLTKDPEAINTASGTAMARFTLAVDRAKKEEGKPDADFINFTVFGKRAETLCKFKKKGDLLGVEGHLQSGSYKKDGAMVYTLDVIADKVEFLSTQQGKGEKQATTQETEKTPPKAKPQPDTAEPVPKGFAVIEEDIPF